MPVFVIPLSAYTPPQIHKQTGADAWTSPTTIVSALQSGRRLGPNDAIDVTNYNDPPILAVDGEEFRFKMPPSFSPTIRDAMLLLGRGTPSGQNRGTIGTPGAGGRGTIGFPQLVGMQNRGAIGEHNTRITVVHPGGGGNVYFHTPTRAIMAMPGPTVIPPPTMDVHNALLALLNQTNGTIGAHQALANRGDNQLIRLDDQIFGNAYSQLLLMLVRPGLADTQVQINRWTTPRDAFGIPDFYL
jgi:hypothetical protein